MLTHGYCLLPDEIGEAWATALPIGRIPADHRPEWPPIVFLVLHDSNFWAPLCTFTPPYVVISTNWSKSMVPGLRPPPGKFRDRSLFIFLTFRSIKFHTTTASRLSITFNAPEQLWIRYLNCALSASPWLDSRFFRTARGTIARPTCHVAGYHCAFRLLVRQMVFVCTNVAISLLGNEGGRFLDIQAPEDVKELSWEVGGACRT